jgi:tetratricopeptide (TPR) repeat protein
VIAESALLDGLVGWLVSVVGSAVSTNVRNATFGSRDENALRKALQESVAAVVAEVPATASADLAAALSERGGLAPLAEVRGTSPQEIFGNAIRQWLCPLAEAGQTLENHGIDPSELAGCVLDALLLGIQRAAVVEGSLSDLAQLIGIEQLAGAQRRLTEVLWDELPNSVLAPSVNTLPRSVTDFTGRDDLLEQIRATSGRDTGTVVSIQAIDGLAGVGKTELAVRAAHELSDQYSHAQLYLDLRGFTPGQVPMRPALALESLLLGVGVRADQIPPGIDQRAALWRARSANKRMVLVLDNAANDAQVRPLLPGTGECLVLITSRRSMADLEGVELLTVDTLDEPTAEELFNRVVGARRVCDDDAVRRVVRLCGNLPLAIRLAAGRLRLRPQLTVADLASDLAAARSRLDALDRGRIAVRAAFDLSYNGLRIRLRELFRCLGLHPGPTITIAAAAALANIAEPTAEQGLTELIGHSLVQEPTAGRFVLHDLLHEYARECAAAEDEPQQIAAAEQRLLEHYLSSAHAVRRWLSSTEEANQEAPARIASIGEITDLGRARQWVKDELANILACVSLMQQRLDVRAFGMAEVLGEDLITLGYLDAAESVYSAAWTVARQLSDQGQELSLLHGLGNVESAAGNYGQARTRYEAAHTLSTKTGDRACEAAALHAIGDVDMATSDYGHARANYDAARTLSVEIGDRPCEVAALHAIGDVDMATSDYPAARSHYQAACTLSLESGYRPSEALALHAIGDVDMATSDYPAARSHYQAAHDIYASIGNRRREAHALQALGDANRATGSFRAAYGHYMAAYNIYGEIGDRAREAHALHGLGELERASGEYSAALTHLEMASAIYKDIGDMACQADVLHCLGELHKVSGCYQYARASFGMAKAIWVDVGNQLGEARGLRSLGDVAAAEGDNVAARSDWQRAALIFTRLGLAREVNQLRQRLDPR